MSAAVVWGSPIRKNDPPFYPVHFLQRAQAGAVLVLTGTDDPFYTVDEAQAVFSLLPSAEKRLVVFEGGHEVRPEDVPAVVQWLDDHVDGGPD